ncbi:MAG: D-inositol-3-phosphate glycosyltransferase [Acidimicrobiales bacterium]|nr:MAG: glycosyltransferase family 1 protein [Actinomycetota bacterium]MBV6508253.1 D-inositol-3-phosphate glycosyltransferase [Acidimicrobiales bacterium]RIK07324.1 MAG: glycosyltransferase family 1 protein [Acidobacteriota bacterium]
MSDRKANGVAGRAASDDTVKLIGDVAADAGLRRIHILSWRDLADVEAGGSELHAATIAEIWARAGVEVTLRTSYAQGHPPTAERDGYHVIRRAGRYMVFPRAVLSELRGRHGERDGLVEIWNGMPFFSPVWCRGPRMVWLHHVHGPMWNMTLPDNLARLGLLLEERIAPRVYRRSAIVTLSRSSKAELVDELGFGADGIHVVPPGIDPAFSPGGAVSATPLAVAVGRLVPVKRFDSLIRCMAEVRHRVPQARLIIVGEGYERDALEELIRSLDAEDWVTLPGRIGDDELVDLYRSAWLVASSSVREGWGMTITEAAACGTPAVATRIAGHLDAVVDGVSGLLAPDDRALADSLAAVLSDRHLRDTLGRGALAHAANFTWESTALGTMSVLAADARRRGHPARS